MGQMMSDSAKALFEVAGGQLTSESLPAERRTYFVSRHPGATHWAAEEGFSVDECVNHLDISRIQRGDVVIGTLPVQLIARVCQQGARYCHLSLDLPADWRGLELSADQLRACNARLEEFLVQRVG